MVDGSCIPDYDFVIWYWKLPSADCCQENTVSFCSKFFFVMMVTVYVGTIDSKADYFEKVVALQIFQVVCYVLHGLGLSTLSSDIFPFEIQKRLGQKEQLYYRPQTKFGARQYLPSANKVGQTPPADGYCWRRYASYWNAFLFHKRVSFCPQGEGLASQHASQVTWPDGDLHPRGIEQTPPDTDPLDADPPLEADTRPHIHGILRDTVNKRAVRILLECILVFRMSEEQFCANLVMCNYCTSTKILSPASWSQLLAD